MRVTSNSLPGQLLYHVGNLNEKEYLLQRSITTSKKIQDPSDDPIAFRQAMNIQQTQRQDYQFSKSIQQVQTKLKASHQVASDLQTIITRASELAVKAGGAHTQGDYDIIATEVNSLIENAMTLANKQDGGQFLFGGTGLQPSDSDTVGANPAGLYKPFVGLDSGGNITTIGSQVASVTYRGNTTVNQVNIDSSTKVDANVLGSTGGTPRGLFVSGASSIFDTLIDFRDQLNSGTVNTSTVLSDINSAQDNAAAVVGSTAAALNRLDMASQTNSWTLSQNEARLSALTSTDLATTVMQLQQTQTAMQAALKVGANILNLSLLNYM